MYVHVLLLTLGFILAHTAFAGGFDRPNLLSGKYVALGGAASSSIAGPEALYFNPAGLAQTDAPKVTADATLVFTEGAVPIGDGSQKSTIQKGNLLGLFGAVPATPRLTFGAGLYGAGGLGSNFGNVSFGPLYPALRPEMNTMTSIFEGAVGAGYELLPGLRLGAAWRVLLVMIDSKGAAAFDTNGDGASDVLFAPELRGLSDTVLNAFRFGLQLAPKGARWGLGTMFRTAAKFAAKGQSGGFSESAGSTSVAQVQGGGITVSSEFPKLWTLGGHYDLAPELRLFLEYTYINSSAVRSLSASGDSLRVPGLGAIPASSLSAPTNWRNQHTARVAAQFDLQEDVALRASYIFATQVVPNQNASPFLTAPGNEHVAAAGVGFTLTILGAPTTVDLAFEFETVSGTSANPEFPTLRGDYRLTSVGFFGGFTRKL